MFALGDLFDIVPAIIPVDLQTGSNAGDYISLKHCQGVAIVIFCGVGTAGQDLNVHVDQATAVAGTGSKDLDAIGRVYQKQGALLTAVGTWTKVADQTLDEDLVVDTDSAENQQVVVIQIEAEMLDGANGYDCLRVVIDDVGGNAKLGCALYIPYGLRYAAAPEKLPSMIID